MERRYKWRFIGGGILDLDGLKVMPGRTFFATPSQIPEEFRDRVVREGPSAIKPAPPESETKQEEKVDAVTASPSGGAVSGTV